ncbi:MAG: Fe-S cluster assembly protein SufD [Acidobacteria bacterium]|nr:Fe-S cluster assembly protein SufD [Acidobacteriota bacterium]
MTETSAGRNTFLEEYSSFEKSDGFRRHAWLRPLREAALSSFKRLGFPTTRNEEWRHTNVAPIANSSFRLPAFDFDRHKVPELANFTFSETECCQLIFINGIFSQELSSAKCLPRGGRMKSLAAALETEKEIVAPWLASLASHEHNAFTALNTAFLSDGAFVYLPPGTVLSEVLHLVFVSTTNGHAIACHPRNLIVIGDRCQAGIVESYAGLDGGRYLTNAVTEIVLGSGAQLDHYKLQRESEEAFHMATLQVLQDRDSHFTSHSISLGGTLTRNDANVVMNAEGAECHLNGLYATRGRQHIDNHTCIDHARPHCDSRELYKGILDDRSSAVFNGRIIVRKDAQKSNAKQTNRNLLLSEEAVVNAKPQLEIFADDVKCTHGATIGHLDEEELFYTRSRGIGLEAARTLLTYAFASDILNSLKFKPIQCQIDLVLLSRLSRSRSS